MYTHTHIYSHPRQSVFFVIHHMQSGENDIFLTNKLLNQMEISGGKVEFQYLIRKLLVSPALLIEAVCVPGQIHYISSDFSLPVWPLSLPLPSCHSSGRELSCARAQRHRSSAVRFAPSPYRM